jgi:hypothetical protein
MVEPMDNRTLLRRTFVAVSAMLAGCALVVGMVTLVAVSIVGHAASAETTATAGPHSPPSGVKPPSAGATTR